MEKLRRRNQKTNQFFLFLPERLPESLMSISHAKTRNGRPRSIAMSDNLERVPGAKKDVRKALIITCPHIP